MGVGEAASCFPCVAPSGGAFHLRSAFPRDVLPRILPRSSCSSRTCAVVQEARGASPGSPQTLVEESSDWLPAQKLERPLAMRDMDIAHGQALTLGDTTLTFTIVCGHTPGTLCIFIPVKWHGEPLVVWLHGGGLMHAAIGG